MPSPKSALILRISTWVLAVLILLLTSCKSEPTRLPSAPPQVQLQPREKPREAMQPMAQPNPPADLSKLPEDQQAAAAQVLYLNVLDFAGKCWKSRNKLIQWINGE